MRAVLGKWCPRAQKRMKSVGAWNAVKRLRALVAWCNAHGRRPHTLPTNHRQFQRQKIRTTYMGVCRALQLGKITDKERLILGKWLPNAGDLALSPRLLALEKRHKHCVNQKSPKKKVG